MNTYLNTYGNPWNALDEWLQSLITENNKKDQTGRFPHVNVWEKEDTLIFEAEVPGCAPEQLAIGVEGNALTIRGEKPKNGKKVEFQRSFNLSFELDPDQIKATLKNGILTITVPRKASAKRKIEIEAL